MQALIRWRWPALVALVLPVAALLPWAIRATRPDNALTVWFLETDPQLRAYREFQDQFGNDEVILLQVEERGGIFTAAALGRLVELTDRLEKIEGIAQVYSVTSARDAFESDDGLRFERVVPDPIPTDPASLVRLEDAMTSSTLFRDRLINRAGTRAMLWIQMATMDDIDARRDAIVARVREAAAAVLGDTPHPMGGVGVIYAALNAITQRDFALFAGAGYAIMFLMMWWVFRKLRLVLAALGVIVLATLAALGAYGLAGHRLNLVTMMLPTLILVLGIADAVHFPTAFIQAQHEFPGRPRREVVASALRDVLFPCGFNTATTVAGFIGLATAPMAVVRHLGVYTGIGLAVALVAALVLMLVAFLSLPEGTRLPEHRWIGRLHEACRRGIERRPALLAWTCVALVGLGLGGASRVRVDTYTLGYFPRTHQVVRDHDAIESGWGRYAVLEFTVKPAGGLRADSPEVLAGMERFIARASALPEVRSGTSLHTLFRRMASVLGREVPPEQPMPEDLVAQLRLLLDMQAFEWDRSEPSYRDNLLAPLMVQDGSLGRLTLVCGMMSAVELDGLLARLHALASAAMAGAGTLEPAGYPPLYVKIIDYVMRSQIGGFGAALGVLFALLLLWLRSLRLTLIAFAPNLFPVVLVLGAMGALGIPLDVGTATVCAIVLGVSFDDTVHYLHHWRQGERAGLDWDTNVRQTFAGAGTPATVTALLLVVGYPVLMLAQVSTVFYFGLLTTLSAITGLAGDLVLLPLLLKALPARVLVGALQGAGARQ